MSEKPETLFRKKVDRDLKKFKNIYSESIQQVAIRGSCDKICCVNGYYVALELKRDEKEDIVGLQDYKAIKITQAKGFHFKVDPVSWDLIKDFLTELTQEEPCPLKLKRKYSSILKKIS